MNSTTVVPPGWTAARRCHGLHPPDQELIDAGYKHADREDRSGAVRGGEERTDLGSRGNEDRPGENRLFATVESRRRYSCGIFDIPGNMVAQGPDLPIHLGSMPDAVRAVVRAFPDVAPGDVFIHNDPYQGGSHLPDVNVVAPAYCGTAARLRLRARALAGYRQRHARQLWRRDGNLRRGPAPAAGAAVSRRQTRPGDRGHHLRQCPHTPERLGDLRAQVAANRRAEARLARWPKNMALTRCLASWRRCRITPRHDACRAAATARRRGRVLDVFDGDGVIAPGETEDRTFTVKLRIDKRGDTISVDFTGSDPRSPAR